MIRIRKAERRDTPFIGNAWSNSFERFSMLNLRDRRRTINPCEVCGYDGPWSSYRKFMCTLIDTLMLEDGAETRVAVADDDPSLLLAFACFKGHELHYVYVKEVVRKLGIVPRLLEGVDVRYITFRTDACENRLRASARGWQYRPRLEI